MKLKFIIITSVGVSILLVFYFLIPVTFPIGIMCHSKQPKPDEGSFGYVIKFTLFGYAEFLLNGEKLENGMVTCTPE